jgi:hypothetical protein
MMRLKHKEIKEYREQRLKEQKHVCALCNDYIEDDAVLDHDHKTGKIRRVLHRGCNALLGKIENSMAMNRVDFYRLEHWASNLVGYLQQEYEDIVHPTYRTPEEKKQARAASRKRAAARRKKHART